MKSDDLNIFPHEERRLNIFGNDVTGNRDVIILNSRIPRHLMAHHEIPARLKEMIGIYYQSNTFFLGLGCMQKFEATSKSRRQAVRFSDQPDFDPAALTNLNDYGLCHLRKLWVNVP